MNTERTLIDLGSRIRRYRLNQNLSQKEVSERAGIGLASLCRMEEGKGSTLSNLVRVLTALDVVSSLDAFLPMPEVSPIQMAKLRGKVRQKASRKSE